MTTSINALLDNAERCIKKNSFKMAESTLDEAIKRMNEQHGPVSANLMLRIHELRDLIKSRRDMERV